MKPHHLLCLLLAALNCISLVSSTAYCTYHNYNSGDSLTTVACSDGANGIMTRFGYSNISPMYPYVAAFNQAGWNSPKCGQCIKLTDNASGRSIFLTVIDQCGGPPGGYDAHFDIAPPAFNQLFGSAGVNAGHGGAAWSVVASSNCKGNKGNTGGTPSTPPPPTSGGNYRIRCGSNWADANGRCGKLCTNDAQCGGQRCYADLNTAPCGRALGDELDTFEGAAAVAEYEEDDNQVAFDAAVAEHEEENQVAVDAAVGEYVEDNQVAIEAVDAAVGEYDEDNQVAADYAVDAANVDYAVDYAVADTSSSTSSSSSDMSGWMIALIALGSIVIVLLVVVIIQLVLVAKRHN